ncbi:MAG: hypothetical protein ACI9P3_002804 [Bradyrhizobium sp.]|jgi:hypothetical protein
MPLLSSGLASVDKSEVSALKQIRRKIAENSPELIRRKYSIDGG